MFISRYKESCYTYVKTLQIFNILRGVFKKRPNFLNSAPISTVQFSGCSSINNAHSETRQTEVSCQILTLGALSSRSSLSVLFGTLFKKFGLFLNTPWISVMSMIYTNKCFNIILKHNILLTFYFTIYDFRRIRANVSIIISPWMCV
jgi:hypothetical protein